MEYKLVIGTKDGKCHQVELKGEQAEVLHDKIIGEIVNGDVLGFVGYEFLITGGSDKCGFPMRKGIQEPRKKVLIGKSVGFCGLKCKLRKKGSKKRQKGLVKRITVCGERISRIIRQVNLKTIKEGSQKLGVATVQEPPAAD